MLQEMPQRPSFKEFWAHALWLIGRNASFLLHRISIQSPGTLHRCCLQTERDIKTWISSLTNPSGLQLIHCTLMEYIGNWSPISHKFAIVHYNNNLEWCIEIFIEWVISILLSKIKHRLQTNNELNIHFVIPEWCQARHSKYTPLQLITACTIKCSVNTSSTNYTPLISSALYLHSLMVQNFNK